MATDSLPPLGPDVEVAPPANAREDIYGLHGVDLREKALPIRPGDLTRLLMAQPGLSADDRRLLGRLGARLGCYFHDEFYQRLRDLKETYAPLDPDSDYAYIPGHTRPRHRDARRGVPGPLRVDPRTGQLSPAQQRRHQGGDRGAERTRAQLRARLHPVRAPQGLRPGLHEADPDLAEHQDQVPQADRDPRRLSAPDRDPQVPRGDRPRPARPQRRRLPADVQGRPARRHGDAPARAGNSGQDAVGRQGPDRLAADGRPADRRRQAPARRDPLPRAARHRPLRAAERGRELVLRVPPGQAQAPLLR